jgi:hypothetical protein
MPRRREKEVGDFLPRLEMRKTHGERERNKRGGQAIASGRGTGQTTHPLKSLLLKLWYCLLL